MGLKSNGQEHSAVITGIGLAVPGASTPAMIWDRLARGIAANDPQRVEEDFSSESSREDRTITLARRAAERALEDAGLTGSLGMQTGCSLSSSKGGLLTLVSQLEALKAKGPESLSSHGALNILHGGVAGALCSELGIEGPTTNLVAACATGIASLAAAKRWIETGRCDCVLAGSTEAAIHPFIQSAFDRMGVLSKTAPRPLDQERDGFVMGEGSVAFVVESLAAAKQRGAVIHAVIGGAAVVGDATHETRMNSSGESIVRAVKCVLKESQNATDKIDAVNLHATGTRAGDPVESTAMHVLFRDQIKEVSMSATKGATGHLLGAAGSLEAALSILSP